ncbi:hypothetical protein LINPERPRIM_LOCUS22734 [Linum perenne]
MKASTLSKAKKVQARKASTSTSTSTDHHLQNLVLNSLVVLGFSLFWYSHTKEFVSQHVPDLMSCLSSHKCVFLLVNAIVVFLLVGESRLERLIGWSESSSAVDDVYDEYIRRSRAVREESVVVVSPAPVDETTSLFPVEVEVADEAIPVHDDEVEEEEVDDDVEEKQVIVCEEKEEEKIGGDELNKRIEEFIARVNRQRQVETSQLFVSCKA